MANILLIVSEVIKSRILHGITAIMFETKLAFEIKTAAK